MNTVEYFLEIFTGLAIVFILGYILAPDKKFLRILDDAKATSAESMMLWGVIPIGTLFIGSKRLTLDQLEFYGLEPPEEIKKMYLHYSNNIKDMSLYEQKYLPRFRTKFLAFIIPLIPLRTQIIFNEENKGIIFREGKFNVIPVEMYWKQAFLILAISYTFIFVLIVILSIIF
jgi:hypothetical protein